MSVNPLYIALALGMIIGVVGYAQTRDIVPSLIGAAGAFAVVWLGAKLFLKSKPPAA